jgi:tRNA(Ile)-lysidine synthase
MSRGPVQQLLGAVRASGLLGSEHPVVVMLSGGRDSVCLLDAVVMLRGIEHVHALHVNYGLRPEAAAEEQHCRSLCARLGAPLEVVHATGTPGGDGSTGSGGAGGRGGESGGGGNVQAWARELRYEAAERLAAPLDALIAAGHTATDQVESILYRLAASPGRRALLGMVAAEGRLVRPLLTVTRAQTAEYCRARGLSWCDDSSNDTDKYARGRVRGGLVPALRAVHPAAEVNVLRTAELLREETELLEGLVSAELGGEASIALERLAELPTALARLVVVRLAEQAAGTYVPQAGGRVAELIALAGRPGGAELHVGGLVSAVVAAGRLSMKRIEPHYRPPDGH